VFSVSTYQTSDREIGIEFLRHILPDTDNTFWVFDYLNGAGLKIENAHHDAPVGGEWYYCVPLAWMLMNGNWWGLENDSDEMIPEIHDALLGEWETEFLNKELSAIKGTPQEKTRGDRWWQGTSQRLALDIEFPTIYKKFIAQYKVSSSDKYLRRSSRNYRTSLISTMPLLLTRNGLIIFTILIWESSGMNWRTSLKGMDFLVMTTFCSRSTK
jgi:hypothetical protein